MSVQSVFKGLRLDEITKGGSINGNKKAAKHWALGHIYIKRQEDEKKQQKKKNGKEHPVM